MSKIVAGNWKLNTTIGEGEEILDEILRGITKKSGCRVIVAPPFTHLHTFSQKISGKNNLLLAAQDCSSHISGAFTGEVSAAMIRSAGASHVIIGHSERRVNHGEKNEILGRKLDCAFSAGLVPIFCCGETLEERESRIYFKAVEKQLEVLFLNSGFKRSGAIVAYEPVWAIGTGKTATAAQAGEMHMYISEQIVNAVGAEKATEVPIIYGGSCKPANAAELFSTPGIDGGLIGGASLSASDFLAIIASAEQAE